MIPDFELATLSEKQQYYFNAAYCPYCKNASEYVDSIEVYQESHGMIWICKPCRAWVGVHNKNTDQAFGFLAKKPLRELRHTCHKYFDPLLEAKIKRGMKKNQAQSLARAWLGKFLGLPVEVVHIGMFDEEQCIKTIEECSKYYLTEEQKAEQKRLREERIKLVYLSGSKFQFSVSRFDLNGVIQLSLTSLLSGGVANYKPIENLAVGIAETKWLPVPDLEEWISDQFADPYRPVRRNRKLKNVSKS